MLAPSLPPADGSNRTRLRLTAVVAAVFTMGALGIGLTLTRVLEHAGRRAEPIQVVGSFATFDAARLDAAALGAFLQDHRTAAPPRALVVHFRDPGCECSRRADHRFLALAQRQSGRNVQFAFSDPPGVHHEPERGLDRLAQLPPGPAARLWRDLPTAPAIAVFDGFGRPLYVGPYADGRNCSAERGGAVEATLASLDTDGAATTAPPVPDKPCTCGRARRTVAAGRSVAALP
ncbi:MAG: DUF6436 domain-containing protein [Burkholderiales bacterium]